ncbi:MAG: homocysteine S-methyltransferase family protein, partial [Actinomycetota bacterium]|nr:homocysteine S-methyltransferase family protein [Actinomycetota bacterium]
ATALEVVPEGVATGGYANRFVAGHSGEVRANAGLASFRDDLDPSSYGGFVAEWLRMGATHVGGCCGMEPAHISEIAALVAAA